MFGVPGGGKKAFELLIDLLSSANGETFETLQPFVRELKVAGVTVTLLNMEVLLRSKTDYRDGLWQAVGRFHQAHREPQLRPVSAPADEPQTRAKPHDTAMAPGSLRDPCSTQQP